MRVLYVHGLESGPGGRKVRNLEAAGFEVIAPAMPCGRRALFRDPTAWPLLALAKAGRPRRVTQRIWTRSLAVQRAALRRGGIDVVVGSSFGGAITVQLLIEGAWTGPTVLLCPAQGLVAERLRLPVPSLRPLPEAVADRVIVVHAHEDEVVPYAHSLDLVRGTPIPLRDVHDDHRLTLTSTPEGLAAWIRAASEE